MLMLNELYAPVKEQFHAKVESFENFQIYNLQTNKPLMNSQKFISLKSDEKNPIAPLGGGGGGTHGGTKYA